jgi:ABC-type protease/lipase transport system fused ATPase/permease subunit
LEAVDDAGVAFGFQAALDILRSRILSRVGERFDRIHSDRVHEAVVRLPLINRMPGDGLQPLRDLDVGFHAELSRFFHREVSHL